MKELLVLLIAMPVVLLIVVSNGLEHMTENRDAAATPVPILIPLTLPEPKVGPTVVATVTAEDPRIIQVINAASAYLGTRYLWSGCTQKGIDCSCLVMNAYAVIGVHLPRVTVDQIRVTTPVAASEVRAGDLVFFDNTCTNCGTNPTHVGLVISQGRMIDAGDPVKIEAIYGGHNARYTRVIL